MRKNRKAFIYTFVFSIFQYSGLILALVLEYFSTKKMGVARYLLFKKQVFETTVFSHSLMNIYNILFMLGAVICFFLLIWGKKKNSILFAAITNLIGFAFIQFKVQLNAYYFFIIGIFVVVIFQYLHILLRKIKKQG